MAEHVRFGIDTGIPVCFYDPHSPWQRPTSESATGLFRQYFPKGMDLTTNSQADLDVVAQELNGRPRHMLGLRTPSEVFTQTVATTSCNRPQV